MALFFTGCISTSSYQKLSQQINTNTQEQKVLQSTLLNLQAQNEQLQHANILLQERMLLNTAALNALQQQNKTILHHIQQQNRQTSDNSFETYQSPIQKQIVGKIEKIYLNPPNDYFHARIDTGATTSSLNAYNIEYFERDGQQWVRFETNNIKQKRFSIEAKIVRFANIIQSNQKEPEKRAVVELDVIIGQSIQKAEFNLSNREHMNYSVLIGRNIIQDSLLVDVSKKFNLEPILQKENR